MSRLNPMSALFCSSDQRMRIWLIKFGATGAFALLHVQDKYYTTKFVVRIQQTETHTARHRSLGLTSAFWYFWYKPEVRLDKDSSIYLVVL